MSRRSMRIIKMLLRWLMYAFVFFICGIVLWRICFSGDPKAISVLSVNDRTAAAYAEYGDEWTAYYQSQNKLTRAEYVGEAGVDHNFLNKDNYGYFGVTQSVIIEEARQVQIVFRYNNGTIKHLKQDYALPEMPERSDHLYDVSLVLALDRTPEDDSDNLLAMDPMDEESVKAFSASVHLYRVQPNDDMTVRTEKNLYNYYRYVFDIPENVPMENLLAAYVDIYYVNDITYLEPDADIYTDEPYGTLCIYDYATKNIPYELTRADKKALAGKE